MENTRLLWLGRHAVATACSAGLMALIPTVLYFVLIIWSNDLGGPINLILIPAISAFVGLVISLLIYLPLGWLAENSDLRRWWRTIGLALSAIIAIIVVAWTGFGTSSLRSRAYLFVGVAATYVVSGFFVYLCGLRIGARLLGRS